MGAGQQDFKSNRRVVLSEINVTPLVDVMLVLLIIFMVTAPMMQPNGTRFGGWLLNTADNEF